MSVRRDSLLLCGGLNLFDSHRSVVVFSLSVFFSISLSLFKFSAWGFVGETALRWNWEFSQKERGFVLFVQGLSNVCNSNCNLVKFLITSCTENEFC